MALIIPVSSKGGTVVRRSLFASHWSKTVYGRGGTAPTMLEYIVVVSLLMPSNVSFDVPMKSASLVFGVSFAEWQWRLPSY